MTQELTSCHFIPYEIKHDLGNPISTQILEKNLGFFAQGLAHPCNDRNQLKRGNGNIAQGGDDEIVRLFFDYDKEGLKKLLPVNTGAAIPEYTYARSVVDNLGNKNIKQMTIKRCVSNKRNRPQFTGPVANSWNLFPEKDEVFFIIDYGGHFVSKILKGLSAGTTTRPNIHIINTPATCGDSATKSLPCAKAWNSANNTNVQIYSWYEFDKTNITQANDNVMLSAYQIDTRPSGRKYIQDQTWSFGPQVQPVIRNSQKENNITTIKKLLLEKLDRNTGEFNPGSGNLPSWYVQRKRSGDYLQIKAAKDFPGHAAQESVQQRHYWLQTGPPGTSTTGPQSTRIFNTHTQSLSANINDNKDWYRKRTYFLTQDWPAFTYASYHGVNSILINYDIKNKYNNIFMTSFGDY